MDGVGWCNFIRLLVNFGQSANPSCAKRRIFLHKVRCYAVNQRDGHSSWSTVIPAHSKAAAESVFSHPHVSVNAVYLGFKDCELRYGIGGLSIWVDGVEHNDESPVYAYLNNYYQADISKFMAQLRQEGY
jgi:hypothetical protein